MFAILSHIQVAPLLAARRRGELTGISSPDLGLSTVSVSLDEHGVTFSGGVILTWSDAETIARSKNSCFLVEGGPVKVQTFSEFTNRAYSLYPTSGAPTMLVAGFPMHRIKDMDPLQAARAQVRALGPVSGRVLDTATGLGYTAIELARRASHVLSIELDPAAHEMARANPWSRALFDNPRIELVIGDSFELLPTFPAGAFDGILHDPPTFSLAGDLYSLEFYRELLRVLRRGGRLFHYVGDPESRFGANLTRGVVERLAAAGFTRIQRAPAAFGVRAVKSRS